MKRKQKKKGLPGFRWQESGGGDEDRKCLLNANYLKIFDIWFKVTGAQFWTFNNLHNRESQEKSQRLKQPQRKKEGQEKKNRKMYINYLSCQQ